MEPVSDRVRKVVADTFALPLDEVIPEVGMGSLEKWDSLGHMTLIFSLEEAFGVEFVPDEIERMTDLAGIDQVIKRKLRPPS